VDRLQYMYTNVLWTDYSTCIQMYCGQITVHVYKCTLWIDYSTCIQMYCGQITVHVYKCTVDRLQYMYTNVL
jgi:hypothetical protein